MNHLFNAIRLLWRAEVRPFDTDCLRLAIEQLQAEIAERERQRPAAPDRGAAP
jgi:hypothetical protein